MERAHGRGRPARLLGVMIAVLIPALAACGDTAVTNGAAVETSEASTPAPSARDEGTGPGANSSPETEDPGSGSSFERKTMDTTSDLAFRVHETLSDLNAEVVEGNTVITLPDTVLFDFDKHELREDAAGVLDDLVEVMAYYEDAPVQINGHTDSKGSTDYNKELSERRADSVAAYLTDAGIDESRLTAAGFGDAEPVAPNTHDDGSDNPEGRAQNRRVEIIIEGADFAELDR